MEPMSGSEYEDPFFVSVNPLRQQSDSVLFRPNHGLSSIPDTMLRNRPTQGASANSQSAAGILQDLAGDTGSFPASGSSASATRPAPPLPNLGGSWTMPSFVNSHAEAPLANGRVEPTDGCDKEEDDEQVGEAAGPSPEVLRAREVAEHGGGLSGCTTVMVRHIPVKYAQRKLMRELNSSGFRGQYDFFYLPMDPRSYANRGFAFINFVCPEMAEAFYKKFHGGRLRLFASEKDIQVTPADLQGFEQNVEHNFNANAARKRRTPNNRPVFLRPLPPHLLHCLERGEYGGEMADSFSAGVNDRGSAGYGGGAAMQKGGGHPSRGRQAPTRPPLVDADEVLIPRFCAFCGKPKQADYLFCPYCGVKAAPC